MRALALAQLTIRKLELMEVKTDYGQSLTMMVTDVEAAPALVELELSGRRVELMRVNVDERQSIM